MALPRPDHGDATPVCSAHVPGPSRLASAPRWAQHPSMLQLRPLLPASGGPAVACGMRHESPSGPRHPCVLIRQESANLLSAYLI